MPRLRVVFMGSPDFAVPVLGALMEAGHEIACVYAQPPRPAGRGHQERPAPVHAFAAERGLAVRTPVSFRKSEADQDAFVALEADAAVTAAYGLILPKRVIEAPRLGCLNVHASLLPRWRGAAPIQRAILAGDAETGITLMRMDEGLDTGPILLTQRVPITPDTTAGTLHDALAEVGARLAVEGLAGLAEGRIVSKPQPAEGATYAAKLEREESRLDWRLPAADLERCVRAFQPSPGAWCEVAGSRVKVLAARVLPGAGQPPGTVMDGALTVACGEGALRLERVQREGKAPTDTAAFLRGFAVPAGSRLP
ncbi:MAG: methionyl-tRNA formyltransferase [Rhodospirillales bacterium]|nr:methionyl-tRNA formyltransferase [Rhodospirillales bacterium]